VHTGLLREIHKEEGCLGGINADDKVIFKWILKKYDGMCKFDSSG
jgi:hypothetical protein